MANPFDLYQQRQFEGLDPNLFNQEAFMEQQKGLYAGSFVDQLNALRQQYEQQLVLESQVKPVLDATTNELTTLNDQTAGLQKAATDAQNILAAYNNQVKQAEKEKNDLTNILSNQTTALNTAKQVVQTTQNEINKLVQDKMNYSLFKRNYPNENDRRQAILKAMASNKIAVGKEYENKKKAIELTNKMKKAQDALNLSTNNVNNTQKQINSKNIYINNITPKIADITQKLDQTKLNLDDNQNKIRERTTALQGLQQQFGVATPLSQQALQDAQNIQTRIAEFKGRERPELQSKVVGNYEESLKASQEEFKNIAESATDPVTKQYAKVLLDQRAKELADTFGKKVEDVNKELSANLVLPEQQFTEQDYRRFMGIPEPVQATIPENVPSPEVSILPVEQPVPVLPPALQQQLTAPVIPVQPTPITPVQPAAPVIPVQPAPQPITPVQVQPQPAPQPVVPEKTQVKPGVEQKPILQFNIAQPAKQTGVKSQPMPTQNIVSQRKSVQDTIQKDRQARQQSDINQAGQPQQPFGAITPYVKDGLQAQLNRGFQQAMKLRTQPTQVSQPKMEALEERRRKVQEQSRQAVLNQSKGTPQT